jgi:subfamily B ATP-binding cassette protein MsbA
LDASDTDIIEAAKKANAFDFIQELPCGFDTVISDRGTRLSGGQRQRIAIARAILKNPPVLLLDEATSQLDSESEAQVQKALNALMEDRTVIVIAHRLSTIKKANKIVVLDKGRITAVGNHHELLENSPLYKKLYYMQWGDEEK